MTDPTTRHGHPATGPSLPLPACGHPTTGPSPIRAPEAGPTKRSAATARKGRLTRRWATAAQRWRQRPAAQRWATAAQRWRQRPAAQQRALVAGLPEVLEQVARSLRTGASLSQAVGEAATAPGPAAASLAQVATVHRRGMPLADACHGWARVVPLPEVRVAAIALGLAAAGGAAARAVDGAAASLRDRLAMAGVVRAATAQARLSAAVLATLAPAFTVWSAAADPDVRRFLVGSPPGWVCLAGGALLDLLGTVWMVRIVRSVR